MTHMPTAEIGNAEFIQLGAGAVARTLRDKAREEVSITDFLVGTDVYTALINALAFFRSIGGGKLKIPARVATYDIDPPTPIEIDFSNLCIEGEGINRSVLRNTSTTGVDLFRFKTAVRTQIVFSNFKIQSDANAGHIFTFDPEAGLSFSEFNLALNQLNPAKSIMYADFSGVAGGLFRNTFRGAPGGNWEHGSGTVWGQATAPTVPAWDLNGNNNRIVDNVWEQFRPQARFGTVPFFSLNNYGNSAWFYMNTLREVEVERARRGFVKIAGCLGTTFDTINYYDGDDIDGHLIETATGAGGKACEQTRFINIKRVSGLLVGLAGTTGAVASITRVGSTATATKVAHGYAVGQPVYIAGAGEAEYNDRFVITAKTDDTFDYAVAGTPATPATGAITVAEAACDIKLGPDEAQSLFQGCGGTTSRQVEIDLRSRGAIIFGVTSSRATFHRIAASGVTMIGYGSSGDVMTPEIGGPGGNPVVCTTGLTLGVGGASVRKLLELSQALDFGSIPAHTSAELTVAIAGVAQGDEVVANPNSTIEAGLVYNAWVSAPDTVTLRLANVTAAAIDPINRTWRFRVYQH